MIHVHWPASSVSRRTGIGAAGVVCLLCIGLHRTQRGSRPLLPGSSGEAIILLPEAVVFRADMWLAGVSLQAAGPSPLLPGMVQGARGLKEAILWQTWESGVLVLP